MLAETIRTACGTASPSGYKWALVRNPSVLSNVAWTTLAGSTIIYCDGDASYLELYAYSDADTDVSSVAGRTQLSIGYMGDNALR
jgi:hypothetical protein